MVLFLFPKILNIDILGGGERYVTNQSNHTITFSVFKKKYFLHMYVYCIRSFQYKTGEMKTHCGYFIAHYYQFVSKINAPKKHQF